MPRPKDPAVPEERAETLRQSLLDVLRAGPLTARDLSARLGLRERDVIPHLEHLERSVRARGERLTVLPASCRSCGYTFEDRRALSRPGRCPSCRGERIEAPRFHVEPDEPGG